MTQSLILPTHVNADGLIPFLNILSLHRDIESLVVDFTNLRKVSPAGLTALTSWMTYRSNQNLSTSATALNNCLITSYLRRMNLLSLCRFEALGTTNDRRSENGRFIPLKEIDHEVADLGEAFANCLAPGGEDFEHPSAGLYDASFYLVTEMANNVRQHSRGQGYVSAQTTVGDGFVRIALADSGRGIKGSLAEAGLVDSVSTSDAECIVKSLVALISSKGQPSNEGVGLTLSSRVTALMGGWMMVASGRGLVTSSPHGYHSVYPPLIGDGYPGTLITMAFKKKDAALFNDKLHEAKDLEHLLQNNTFSANFRP